ncbi:MAG: hypothetical protein LBT54_04960 [Bifidobacteriaceae bacterium]|jgi:hypothetical protein|nr:hypothetical protein [Bifidobacteriaceae bacterium]
MATSQIPEPEAVTGELDQVDGTESAATAPAATAPIAPAEPAATAPLPASPPAAPVPVPAALPEPPLTAPPGYGGERRGVRIGTIVWGVIVVLVGLAIGSLALGLAVDLGLAAIVVLVLGGLALVAGALIGVGRDRLRSRGR